jgi:group I intron endonuclease
MTGKYIYKITNINNGYCYIGQSVQPNTRWRQHQRNKYSAIGKAIQKDGVNSFIFEIIEFAENYTERENYWIDYYNSINKGYNQNYANYIPLVMEHKLLDENTVRNIEQDLLTGLVYEDIMKKYGCASESITKINRGEHFYSISDKEYPLVQRANQEKYNIDIINLIITDLKYTELTFVEIGQKYNITNADRISRINLGKQAKAPKDIHYPIRVPRFHSTKLTLKQVWEIEQLLLNTNETYTALGRKYKVSYRTIKSIDQGTCKGSYVMNFIYPLRETCND